MLTGSLGMLPSASISEPGRPGIYEPVRGRGSAVRVAAQAGVGWVWDTWASASQWGGALHGPLRVPVLPAVDA